MVRREADGCRMSGEVGESQDTWILHEQPDHAVALGRRSDQRCLLGADAHLMKAAQSRSWGEGPFRPHHTECRITGTGQIPGGADDPFQEVPQLQVTGQGDHRVQQGLRNLILDRLGRRSTLAHSTPQVWRTDLALPDSYRASYRASRLLAVLPATFDLVPDSIPADRP